MPVPSNITKETAIALVPGATVTQRVDDGGTTYPVYYKLTNDTGEDQTYSVWSYNADFPVSGAGYRPQQFVYADVNEDDFIIFMIPMAALTTTIKAGTTWLFAIFDDDDDDWTPSNLTIECQLEPRFDAVGVLAPGRIIINSASGLSSIYDAGIYGMPAGIIDPEDGGAIVGFHPLLVAGENGDVFPTSGIVVLSDDTAMRNPQAPDILGQTAYWFVGYDPVTFEEEWATAVRSHQLPPDARLNLTDELIYVLSHNGGGSSVMGTLDEAGTYTELCTLQAATPAGQARLFAAADPTGAFVYVGLGFPRGRIGTYSLTTGTYLGDFIAASLTHYVSDLLVMLDGAVVACWFNTDFAGAVNVFVRCYEPDGSTRWTYNPTLPAVLTDINPRLAYSATANTCWFFAHLETGRGWIQHLDVSDGSELLAAASITPDVIQSDLEDGTQEIPYTSDSCPIIELRVAVASITVTKVVDGSDADSTEFTFTAGGGLSPSSFTLQAGESFTFNSLEPGSGYSIVETVPEGWGTPSVVVSNGSPSVNLTVDEGEAVTVTVTNTPDVCECCVSTQLQITNHALAKLGQTRFITDLDEATAEGYTAAQLWDLALHASLRHFPWAFATKYAGGDPSDVEDGYMNLIDGSTSDYAVANEWVYAYRYPVDCMFARRIVPPDGTGRGYSGTPIPFRVGRTWNGTNDVPLIYTNQEDAVLEYTALVECSEDFFDALFEDFLSWRLAGLMAPGLTRTAKTATECYQMAMLLLDQARAVASQEQQQEPNGQATWMQDR